MVLERGRRHRIEALKTGMCVLADQKSIAVYALTSSHRLIFLGRCGSLIVHAYIPCGPGGPCRPGSPLSPRLPGTPSRPSHPGTPSRPSLPRGP